MQIITASTTSNWLKKIIVSNKQEYDGYVLAVFDTSIILSFKTIGLIHFTVNNDNLSPFSIALNNADWENIKPNSDVKLIDHLFYINNKYLTINDTTKTFDESWINPIDKALIPELRTLNPSDFYKTQFIRLREDLISSIFRDNKSVDIIEKFIGIGEGLTPSGDDYLVGFIYGLTILKKFDLIASIKERILLKLDNLTNIISKTFINHALEGRFANSIVLHDWDTLINFGHKSGYFVIQGIYDSIKAYAQTKSTI